MTSPDKSQPWWWHMAPIAVTVHVRLIEKFFAGSAYMVMVYADFGNTTSVEMDVSTTRAPGSKRDAIEAALLNAKNRLARDLSQTNDTDACIARIVHAEANMTALRAELARLSQEPTP